ncbi:piggyBac transposable element-derived protein 4 [Trichonephila clavipes]|nr:piggyBac transposable element-derived protein 4 [Trichonephila clavipes]
MAARKRSAIDSVYIPDDLSDSESYFSFDSDINFSDCSSSSDESDHDSINLQSVRQWCKIDMKNTPLPSPLLFRGNPGITVNIAINASILNYFELFFDDQILRMIVQETNRYAEQYIHKTVCKEGSRWKKWTETNVEELRLFFAVLLLQGVIKKPEQEHYWSKRQTLSTPNFAKVIGRNRFLLLMKFLHFTNNEELDKDRHPWPKLNKIYELMEHLQRKFREVYIPGKNLSLDESLMKFKGRLKWKMYIAKKRARFGLKFFVLCEAGSGYISDFLIYTGDPKYSQYPVSTKIVLHLMDRFLGKAIVSLLIIFMSLQLADILVTEKTDTYRTVNKTRKDFPVNFSKEKVPKG